MNSLTGVDEERTAASPVVTSLMQQFLVWIDTRPRSYEETMDAWQTHCPRFTIWEDALGDGLVQVESGGSTWRATKVVLTPSGRALLHD